MHHLIPIDQLITLVMNLWNFQAERKQDGSDGQGDKLTSTGWTIRLFSFLPAPG